MLVDRVRRRKNAAFRFLLAVKYFLNFVAVAFLGNCVFHVVFFDTQLVAAFDRYNDGVPGYPWVDGKEE
jgi:hypothetical protein